ncbi:MAG: hypothetical protein GWM92_21490 [Gemmatimonadetes bacterium]|nr:hypothetical protein [Gemmatimonadota bacterium]NIR81427.1 hypothetical protein [Gemmatimonadota bacterium]NIT90266.1 hypothetical protein [Gemmatimonadota bacterium]NIU34090.1 hypothetical protein [Gemmatimonadota bacterium]NIU38247.1 hypothetical protein [Gemmatimonadota bacterium]
MSAHPPEGERPPAGETSELGGDRPGAGGARSEEHGAGEEPVATGTLFIMILFLMALAGMWGIMYLTLLER